MCNTSRDIIRYFSTVASEDYALCTKECLYYIYWNNLACNGLRTSFYYAQKSVFVIPRGTILALRARELNTPVFVMSIGTIQLPYYIY